MPDRAADLAIDEPYFLGKVDEMSAADATSLHNATREMLLRERAAVIARMRSITQDALNLEFEQDGVPPSGYEREQALTAMLDGRLAEIDTVLARLDDGSYGICADCHKQIPPRRLEVQPLAVLCVECQSLADKRVRRRV
jgi:DnaK suppressor protein